MAWLLVLALLVAQPPVSSPIDVTKIEVGPPAVVVEIDTGKLKGELRRLCWSPDSASLYLQTAEADSTLERLRHYSLRIEGGPLTQLEREPEWAARYWAVKQDRVAPGVDSLVIEVAQGSETLKGGTGQAGVMDRSSSPDRIAMGSPTPESLANGNMGNERARVVRLTLLGNDIASWTNERPYPGARFSWGPVRSGALVYVGDMGQLVFFDHQSQKRPIASTRDALLPAWSVDGKRLAWLQKTGRKKYAVAWAAVAW